METTIQIHGMHELVQLLKQLPEETRIKALKPSVRKMARVLKEQAVALAPQGATGALKRNIRHVEKKTNAPWISTYGLRVRAARKKARAKAKAEGKADVNDPYYWFFLEYGTVYMRARPFLRPALQNAPARYAQIFRDEMVRRLEKEVKRLYGSHFRSAKR